MHYQENKLTHADSARYGKQKDVLLEKLADFEATNRTLRRLLREQHQAEAAALKMVEQRDTLVIKLSDSERQNEVSNGQVIVPSHHRYLYLYIVCVTPCRQYCV